MSQAEWIKKWRDQAPSLPQPDLNRALLVLSGKEASK
jgi:hypothetical protein